MTTEVTQNADRDKALDALVGASTPRALTQRIHDLLCGAGERAYISGELLNEVRDLELYKQLGYTSMEEYLKKENIRRSTAFSNMKVAEYFERADVAVGISKLRLLVQEVVVDPVDTLKKGWPKVVDGDTVREPIASISFRELSRLVRQLKEETPASSLMKEAAVLAAAFTTEAVLETPSAA